MSKIICDVCGTSYPETATQCPICGCVRPGDVKAVPGDGGETETQLGKNNYTYVKGGRFSKSNVKKRNRALQAAPTEEKTQDTNPKKKSNGFDTALIVIVIALVLAIVVSVSYIAMRVFFPDVLIGDFELPPVGQTQQTTTGDATAETTTEQTETKVACTAISLSDTIITFDKAGAAKLLNVAVEPEYTTEALKFSSTDLNVVTVTQDGKVESVGPGQAVITVTCGQEVAECQVVCDFEDTSSTTSATTEPAYSADDFKLNRSDFTLTKKGESHMLYTGSIPVDSITWTTDNANVVTVEKGKVVAVGKGTTTVHAEYNGTKLSCVVRCTPAVGTAPATNTESQDQPANTSYSISKTDVTLSVGKEFKLQLLDADKKPVSVTWSVQDGSVCSVSGDKVKGLKAGTTNISTVYEGATYSCVVRVK